MKKTIFFTLFFLHVLGCAVKVTEQSCVSTETKFVIGGEYEDDYLSFSCK